MMSMPRVAVEAVPTNGGGPGGGSTIEALTVDLVYLTNSNWTSYVKFDDGGQDVYHQSDDACDGTETGHYYTSCIHGGEVRKVVTTKTSCTNLTITDTLGVFEWVCKVDGGFATFFSRRLKEGKGLKDLVTIAGWNQNSVSVYESAVLIGQSTSAVWGWTNNIKALPDNSASAVIVLDGTDSDAAGPDDVYVPGDILVATTSRDTYGYNLRINRLSLVTMSGVTLTFAAAAPDNCDKNNGVTGGSDKCVLNLGASDFDWIEGRFTGGEWTVAMRNSDFNRFHASYLGTNTAEHFYLHTSHRMMVSETEMTGAGNIVTNAVVASNKATFYKVNVHDNPDGLSLLNISDARVIASRFADNVGQGVDIMGSNSLIHSSYSEGQNVGFRIGSGTNSHIVASTATNNANENFSVYTSTATYTTLLATTSADGPFRGHFISVNNAAGDNSYVTVANAVGVNAGFEVAGQHNDVYDIALYNGTFDIGSNDLNFHGHFLYNLGTQCSVGGTDPGLVTNTCAMAGQSTAVGIPGVNLSTSFLSDYRLDENDTRLLNRLELASSASAAWPADASLPCPSGVDGNQTITNLETVSQTFLRRAYEIMLDDIGDEDGLCESDEACIYTPNFGAYQGEGDYMSNNSCVFQDGTVTGVTMYAYPTNGG